MPRLSKLFFLPAFLSVAAAFLAVEPGMGQVNKSTLTTTVPRLPALNAALAPGKKFEKDLVKKLVGMPEPVSSWVKIPASLACTWKTDKMTQTSSRFEQSMEEDATPKVLKVKNTIVTLGSIRDARGDFWQYNSPAVWMNDTLCIETEFALTPEGELHSQSRVVTFEINDKTNDITYCRQLINQRRFRMLSPGLMREEQTTKLYDWKGSPVMMIKCQSSYNRAREFDAATKTADGKPLYSLFVQFLKDHGMTDRIPDAQPATPEKEGNQ